MVENKNMEELKNKYKMTEIGKISVLWKKYNFGEIIDILTDYHANGSYKILKENIELMDTKDYAVMIRTTNFEQDDFEYNLKYITEDAYNYLEKSKVFPNDILMNKIANAGSVYLMPDLKVPVSLAMNLFLIRINKNNNPIFVYYFLKFKEEFIKLRAQGTVTKTITKDAVRKFPIYLPPLEIQEKIAKILSDLDDKIEINNEMNKTLEEMAQTLFKRWFIDFEFPNGEGEPYKSSGGKMVESELGMIPDGWEVTTLKGKKEFGELVMGLSPKSESYNDLQQGFPLLNGAADFTKLSLSPKKYTTSPTRIAKKGDYVFCIRATIGLLSTADKDYVIGRGVATVKDIKAEYKEYIYMILNNSFGRLKQNATGSVIQGLSKPDINNMKILFPISLTMLNFNKYMSKIFEKIENNKKEIQSLTEIRDILLPKLMSGEIEV